jgi:hypothetical protein
MKKLSIIIVNYNSFQYVQDALRSLVGRNKSLPNKWEILVIDNASTEAVDSEELKKIIPSLKLIRNDENSGFSKANNKAIQFSTAEYILLLNPDTKVSQESIEGLISFMDAHPRAGVSSPFVKLPNGDLDDASHRGFPTPWRAFCYFIGFSSLFPNSMLFNGYHLGYKKMDKSHQIDSAVGACMLIRTKAGERVNWLDEDYFWYGEDLDFCYRLKKQGWEIWFVPEISIFHYKGVTSGIKSHSKNISTADKTTRNNAQKARFDAMELFYKKHYVQKYPRIMTWMVFMGIRILRGIYVTS